MKKIILSLTVIMSGSLLFSACSDDDDKTREPSLFNVTENPVILDGTDKERRIEVTSDLSWTWVKDPEDSDWLNVTRDNDYLILKPEVNPDKEVRKTFITVTSGTKSIEVEVLQDRRTGVYVDVSGDLGYLIVSMSPDGRYLGAFDSSEAYSIIDWNTQEATPVEGTITSISYDIAAGSYNNMPAYYDIKAGTWTTLATPSAARSGESWVISRDGSLLAGYYNYWSETQQSGIDAPLQWDNGNMIELEGFPVDSTSQTYPISISDDGKYITGNYNTGFACYWIDGKLSTYLLDEMFRVEHIIDVIESMGHIWELYDPVVFSAPGYVSPNGKYINGILYEKELELNDDGVTYTRTGNYTFTPYIFNTETNSVRYLEQFKEYVSSHLTSIIIGPIDNTGFTIISNYAYDYENDKTTEVVDWVKDVFGVDIEIDNKAFRALGVAEDRSMFVWGSVYDVGSKTELVYMN